MRGEHQIASDLVGGLAEELAPPNRLPVRESCGQHQRRDSEESEQHAEPRMRDRRRHLDLRR